MKREITEKEITEDLKISKYVFKTFFAGYQYLKEDLIQEGVLALMKAREHFDNTKGAYSTFAFKVAINAMRMYLRKEYKYEENENIEDYTFKLVDEVNDIDNSLNITIAINNSIAKFKNADVMSEIIKQIKNGCAGFEIAEKLQISRTYVSKLLNNLRKQLKTELEK